MKNLESRRVRYLQDAVPVRFGGLAANLSRIASFSQHAGIRETVSDIMPAQGRYSRALKQ